MGRRAHAWPMLRERLAGMLAVALLTATTCSSKQSAGVSCSVGADNQSCSCRVDSNGSNGVPCGGNLTPSASCCALPEWPQSGTCFCTATAQPGLGVCHAPLFNVTRCEPAGETVALPDAGPACPTADTRLPDSQMCCGTSACLLAVEACCITTSPPQALLCKQPTGTSCNGLMRLCGGPGDCTGNACCEDSAGGARCSSDVQCPSYTKPVCKTAADCPANAANCCGIDLILVPMGHFKYGVCQPVC
jgi:hypothetical protein